jgi:hypothetical protein
MPNININGNSFFLFIDSPNCFHLYKLIFFSDQFGTDLTSVEAAFKKQEAIQTDIAAFEERLQNIMAIANELKTEDYHDYATIEARKKNVEMHWEYLVSLVTKRRQCLELAYNLQRVFQVNYFLKQPIFFYSKKILLGNAIYFRMDNRFEMAIKIR